MPLRSIAAAALLAVAVAPRPSSAGDVRAALARAKQAMGGDRWDSLRTMATRARLEVGGLSGEMEQWADVRRGRYASRYTLGPAKGGEGFDGEKAWTQDASGQVRLEEGANAREGAANEAYRTALAYWYPERWPAAMEDGGERAEGARRFAVVRVTPKGGRPFEMWLDAATGIIDRFVEQGAQRVRTVYLSGWREVKGLRIPFEIHGTTGDPKYDDRATVEAVELDVAIEDARFAPPAAPPPDFAIAGRATETTVPFELVNNHIYVDVRLNGKGPFRLLCDTGGANVVTPAVAKALGLEVQGKLEGAGVGEKSEDMALTKVGEVAIGAATLRDQLFFVLPLDSLGAVEGIPEQGLVGYEVFKRFVVAIDYAGRKLTLHAPGTFRPAGGTAVPFRFDGHTPQVEGSIDGIRGSFSLDTGSRGALAILAPFAEEHGLVKRWGARVEAMTGWGVGGPARALLARADRLTLGDVVVERPIVDVSLQKKGAFVDRYVAGNVGGAILKMFTLTFDYARQVVVFEPNALAREPQSWDRSGLWLNLAAGGLEVMDVVAGGPGAKAGLRVGDRIVAVDGVPAAKLSLPEVRERLRTGKPGTKVRLGVESHGKQRAVTLVLADLV